MSVKSSTELMLYVVLTMPTLNKAYLLLFIYLLSIYEILPALDLTQSVHAKISIGMHRGVKFKISRIPLIGLETRLG